MVRERSVAVRAVGVDHHQALSSIQSIVKDLIGQDVAANAPLGTQGLDSLASMELRQKIQVLQSSGVQAYAIIYARPASLVSSRTQ